MSETDNSTSNCKHYARGCRDYATDLCAKDCPDYEPEGIEVEIKESAADNLIKAELNKREQIKNYRRSLRG